MDTFFTQVIVIQAFFSLLSFLGFFLCWRQDRWVFGFTLLLAGAVFVMARFYSLGFWQDFGGHRLGAHIIDALWVEGSEPVPTRWGRVLYPTESWSDWIAWTSTAAGAIVIWMIFFMNQSLIGSGKHVRGTIITPSEQLRKKLLRRAGRVPVYIGNIPIPVALEPLSIALFGGPGTGKTQIIMRMLSAILKRPNRVVAIDVGGELYQKFGRKGDYMLSVSTQETERWSPFSEISRRSDCRLIANALIPPGGGESETWNGYARNLLSNILEKSWEKGLRTNHDLIYYSQSAPIEEIKEMLIGTSSQRLFEPGSEKMASNVLSILSTYMEPLGHLDPDAGEDDFSLTAWLNNNANCQGSLWIVYDDLTGVATASLRAAWIEILIKAALSLKACPHRRLWYFLDELASHGKIETLDLALSRGRKNGLILTLGIQNVNQLYSIYGEYITNSILGSVGHTAILRTPDADTAKYLSETIGDTEEIREQFSKQGNTVSVTKIQDTKPASLDSQISQLPDRSGYLKLSEVGWTDLAVPITQIKGTLALTEKFPRNSDSFSPKSGAHNSAFKAKITTPDNNLDDL